MEELVNLIATDAAANDISDKIKEVLYAKAADKIDASRNTVGASMFDNTEEPVAQEEEPNV
ncbi:MAG: hypothetical protein VXY93_13700 [Pseudomonadota bacterium]|jgi:hypothetical protein|nr:hypothetical protein [Pseudomonadota bacterium]|tara:strand:- start:2317 stop:2499 length:183 start_codon:yes stop_codon:yes gene_type:complete